MSKILCKINEVLGRGAFGQVPAASEARTEPYYSMAREDRSLQRRNWPNLKGPYRQAEAGGGRASHKGFTLIEALIALVLITIAMGPVFILATSAVNVASRIEHNLIASNLAQEGIEVARNIRDTNWLNGVAFDNTLSIGTWRVQWNTVGGGLMAVGLNPALKKNNGLYNYSIGTDTAFRRTVTISKPNSGELVLISSVTWVERGNINRTVSAESHLFDWR